MRLKRERQSVWDELDVYGEGRGSKETHWKGGSTMEQYAGRIKNTGTQEVAALFDKGSSVKSAVKQGDDLRAGNKKKKKKK